MALTKNYMAEAYRLSRKRNAVISILILFTLQSKPEKGYRKLTNEDVTIRSYLFLKMLYDCTHSNSVKSYVPLL